MIKNYLKIALRNLLKNKAFTFINLTGLAVGIASFILIILYVQDELSYDKFHENYDRIYRLRLSGKVANNEFNMAVSCAPLAPALISDLPEVESAARMKNYGFPVFRYDEKAFSEENCFWVDSTFFDIFTVRFLQGDPKSLKDPSSIVITESMAKKYFGNEDPIGKLINSDKRKDYKVTGVIADFPHNSHFHPDFLLSLYSYEEYQNTSWLGNNFYTYALLKKGVSEKEFESKIKELVKKYVGPQIQQALGISYEQLVQRSDNYEYLLQPLSSIHLQSHLEHEIEPNSDITYVYIFSSVALAILLIACINFMNLSTARSAGRAKEVGIRKTLGSDRFQLIKQFLSESILLSFLSIIFALIFVKLLIPTFNNVSGKHLDLTYFDNFTTIPLILLLGILVGFVAGIYPAFFLSSFIPTKVLKENSRSKGSKSWLRSGLVVFQFAVSVILFIGTVVVYNQLDFIQNKKLGFDKEHVIIIEKTDDLKDQIKTLKLQLLENPDIASVSNMGTIPGKAYGSNAVRAESSPPDETHILWITAADYDFKKTFRIEMAAGRYFQRDRITDSTGIVINETAVKVLGIEGDPIGQNIVALGGRPEQNNKVPIIGVMKDFHFESLHSEIRPLGIYNAQDQFRGRYTAVRIGTDDVRGALKFMENKWRNLASDQAFEYVFLDEEVGKLYSSEKRTGEIFTTFSILAIFIACLGLFGLAAYTAEQRTKEIGIRKAMGASIGSIVFLLTKEFTKWVLIATLIAWPLAFFMMNSWLEDFYYRIELDYAVFIWAGLSALFIALITVSYQALKAALVNPIKSLRYE